MPPDIIEVIFPAGANPNDIVATDLIPFSTEWWWILKIWRDGKYTPSRSY